MAIIGPIGNYISSLAPTGFSIYIVIFLGVVLISLSISGNESIVPDYIIVLFMFAFTIWYIYVKLIVPDPLQL